MKKYKVFVDIVHTYENVEILEIEVEAETKDKALKKASNEAYNICKPDCCEAEHHDSQITSLAAVEIEERCKKTIDMFGGKTDGI